MKLLPLFVDESSSLHFYWWQLEEFLGNEFQLFAEIENIEMSGIFILRLKK